MKTSTIATVFAVALNLTVSALDLSARPRPQVNQYVSGVPQCSGSASEGANYYLTNRCNIKVTIVFTSDGDFWGEVSIAPGQRQLTSSMGIDDPRRSGRISLYTCPGDSHPVRPDGSQFNRNYHGPYTCYAGPGFSPN
jgi:hypothetical protein